MQVVIFVKLVFSHNILITIHMNLILKRLRLPGIILLLLFVSITMMGSDGKMPVIAGIRIEFILFALTLIGVAIFHHKTMYVALIGLAVILIYKYVFSDFSLAEHIIGNETKEGEWRILLNLMGLLFGFAILAEIFKESKFPDILPNYLPDDWKGGFVLLIFIFILSSFLDNIAAAMIGGTIAMVVFKGDVHLGYLAAIIAAANAGGAGSVVGDTTTTLMWIDGVNPLHVLHAFIASFAALFVFGIIGSIQQDKYKRIIKDTISGIQVDWGRIIIVFMILICAILTNYLLDFPALGVWIGIIIGSFFRKTPWHEMKRAWMGTIFLMALVTCASLMPVEELPPASPWTALSLGFISAVFDNIPLTKICLEQGGYDWGVLAYTVGFGGSMIWFGSSAGVALSNLYPETKNTVSYLKSGWHVIISYALGFFVLLYTLGWHPHAPHKEKHMQEEVLIEE
jgi:Na+/H+ antiporter NhaD/arsenite permease-like protein